MWRKRPEQEWKCGAGGPRADEAAGCAALRGYGEAQAAEAAQEVDDASQARIASIEEEEEEASARATKLWWANSAHQSRALTHG